MFWRYQMENYSRVAGRVAALQGSSVSAWVLAAALLLVSVVLGAALHHHVRKDNKYTVMNKSNTR